MRRRKAWIAVSVLLGVVLLTGAWAGWTAYRVNQDLTAAVDDVTVLRQAVEDGDSTAADAALAQSAGPQRVGRRPDRRADLVGARAAAVVRRRRPGRRRRQRRDRRPEPVRHRAAGAGLRRSRVDRAERRQDRPGRRPGAPGAGGLGSRSVRRGRRPAVGRGLERLRRAPPQQVPRARGAGRRRRDGARQRRHGRPGPADHARGRQPAELPAGLPEQRGDPRHRRPAGSGLAGARRRRRGPDDPPGRGQHLRQHRQAGAPAHGRGAGDLQRQGGDLLPQRQPPARLPAGLRPLEGALGAGLPRADRRRAVDRPGGDLLRPRRHRPDRGRGRDADRGQRGRRAAPRGLRPLPGPGGPGHLLPRRREHDVRQDLPGCGVAARPDRRARQGCGRAPALRPRLRPRGAAGARRDWCRRRAGDRGQCHARGRRLPHGRHRREDVLLPALRRRRRRDLLHRRCPGALRPRPADVGRPSGRGDATAVPDRRWSVRREARQPAGVRPPVRPRRTARSRRWP